MGEVGLLLKSLLSVCESQRDSLKLEEIETEQKTALCVIVSLREGSMWRLVVDEASSPSTWQLWSL